MPPSVSFAKKIKQIVIQQSMRAKAGHIGSALSIADLIGVLYEHILDIPSPKEKERDYFILSKGHAALALYAAIYLKGWIDQKTLDSYCQDDSLLGVHPEHMLAGVDISTGSLGQGLPIATGLALANRLRHSNHKIYCLISDAELNEGSTWEAILFAAHHGLHNLVVILDFNRQQALGYTEEVLRIENIADKMESFGFQSHDIDGHDEERIRQCLEKMTGKDQTRPHFIVANTVLGKDVPFMEKKIPWHYKSMNEKEFAEAKQYLDKNK